MPRKTIAAIGALALAATSFIPSPAQAVATVSVTAGSCGRINLYNGTSTDKTVGVDNGTLVDLLPGQRTQITSLPGGSYAWGVYSEAGIAAPRGTVTVATCAGGQRRPARGDISGDGIADVLGITTTGDLYYYRMGATALADGVKVGHSWGSTVWMQRVEGWYNGKGGRRVIAVRKDGTVWRYDELGGGRLGDGKQIGTGFGSFTAFGVLPANNMMAPGMNMFLAAKDGTVGVWGLDGDSMIGQANDDPETSGINKLIGMQDFDGDKFADLLTVYNDGNLTAGSTASTAPERKVGFGWQTTAMLNSPGSFQKDTLSDLIGRRTDGNLYRYTNAGGKWDSAQRIGQRWWGIRMLA